jgi:hypothetical protein
MKVFQYIAVWDIRLVMAEIEISGGVWVFGDADLD